MVDNTNPNNIYTGQNFDNDAKNRKQDSLNDISVLEGINSNTQLANDAVNKADVNKTYIDNHLHVSGTSGDKDVLIAYDENQYAIPFTGDNTGLLFSADNNISTNYTSSGNRVLIRPGEEGTAHNQAYIRNYLKGYSEANTSFNEYFDFGYLDTIEANVNAGIPTYVTDLKQMVVPISPKTSTTGKWGVINYANNDIVFTHGDSGANDTGHKATCKTTVVDPTKLTETTNGNILYQGSDFNGYGGLAGVTIHNQNAAYLYNFIIKANADADGKLGRIVSVTKQRFSFSSDENQFSKFIGPGLNGWHFDFTANQKNVNRVKTGDELITAFGFNSSFMDFPVSKDTNPLWKGTYGFVNLDYDIVTIDNSKGYLTKSDGVTKIDIDGLSDNAKQYIKYEKDGLNKHHWYLTDGADLKIEFFSYDTSIQQSQIGLDDEKDLKDN